MLAGLQIGRDAVHAIQKTCDRRVARVARCLAHALASAPPASARTFTSRPRSVAFRGAGILGVQHA